MPAEVESSAPSPFLKGTPMSNSFPAQRCVECGAYYGHPSAICRDCGADCFKQTELSGEGQVYASTVVHVPPSDYEGEAPFVVGLIDVGELTSVRVTARIEGAERPDPGTPVEFVGQVDDSFQFRVSDSV
jgi:uncharacterized OB-fold protein